MSELKDSLQNEIVYKDTIELIFPVDTETIYYYDHTTFTVPEKKDSTKIRIKCLVYENGKECGMEFDNLEEFLLHLKYYHGLEW